MKPTVPYELKLYDDSSLLNKQEVVSDETIVEVVSTEAEKKQIVTLRKEIAKEQKKAWPDLTFIARKQHEIVVLKETIFKKLYVKTK